MIMHPKLSALVDAITDLPSPLRVWESVSVLEKLQDLLIELGHTELAEDCGAYIWGMEQGLEDT